jgi:acyl carrier protein
MENKIKELFVSVLQVPIEEVVDESSPDNLVSWHSLNHLILISVFEEYFAINIDPDEMTLMQQSFGKFREIISKKIGMS